MKTEKGVVIIAYKPGEPPRYLVLKRKKNWDGWETPKGHLEDGDYRKTARIELQEEAGIEEEDIRELEEMDETVSWEYEEDGEEFRREYRAFLAELDPDAFVDVSENPHDEHEDGYFFRFRDAKQLLTYDDNLELLKSAHQRIGN